MKRVEYFELLTNLFQYKTVYDKTGNEYVLFANSSINYLPEISDKTAFESLENHIHLLYNVRKEEYKNLIEVGRNWDRLYWKVFNIIILPSDLLCLFR